MKIVLIILAGYAAAILLSVWFVKQKIDKGKPGWR